MGGRSNGMKWQTDRYWQTAGYNNRLYVTLRNQIMGMALTRYHWINLPDSVDERFLELTLFNQGIATLATPRSGAHAGEWLGLMVGGWQSAPDMYGNPKRWNALGMNGYQFYVTPLNGMYIWDNHLRTPIIDRIDVWVRELVDIIRTMQQNRVHQKTPLILYGPQEKRLDLTNYIKQLGGGEVAIIASDGITDLQATTLTPPNATPYLGEQLWATYQNIWGQIYGSLGISNLPFKAERQIEDEVRSQTDPTDIVALDGLTTRRQACQYLNTHFPDFADKPLDVVWRADNETTNYDATHDLTKLTNILNGNGTDDDTEL